MSYAFLKKETAPRILVEAYKLIGTKEIVGKDHNPKILQWAKDLGMEKTYTNDEIPWCGLFMAHVCRLAGVDGVVTAFQGTIPLVDDQNEHYVEVSLG